MTRGSRQRKLTSGCGSSGIMVHFELIACCFTEEGVPPLGAKAVAPTASSKAAEKRDKINMVTKKQDDGKKCAGDERFAARRPDRAEFCDTSCT